MVFPRRPLRALVAFSLFVTGLVTMVAMPTAATTENPCTTLKTWAAVYRGVSPSLDDLARFDRAHRIAIFNAVTPAVRASLWQEQLRRFDQRTDLSAAQHALLQEAAAVTTPALYAREPQAVAAHEAFWAKAEQAFTTPRDRRVMFDLGAVAPTFDATAARGVSCNCSRSSSGECDGACSATSACSMFVGCGPSGTSMCNGMCN